MKLFTRTRLLSALLILALAVGLLATAVLAAPVTVAESAVHTKTGFDGSIVVTVYDHNPGTAGTGGQVEGLTGPVQGVGIDAVKIGTVAEVTTTETSGTTVTTNTQVGFGLTNDIITLLGLNTDAAFAVHSDTYYFAPTTVTAVIAGKQSAIEAYMDTVPDKMNDVTEQNGTVTFSNLEHGLYLLAKSELPAEATTDLVPFLVSVPMYVDPNWQNMVYVYPKVRTETLEVTKTAKVGEDEVTYVNAGETLSYTISIPVPNNEAGSDAATAQDFTTFIVTDTNTGNTLDIVGGTEGVTVSLAAAGGQNLLEAGDYAVSYNDSGEDGVLTVTLKSEGLAALNKAVSSKPAVDGGYTFTISYDATVATDVDFSTGLHNAAQLTYERGQGPIDTPPQDTVTVETFGIDLTKTLSDSAAITASAITFRLYTNAECTTEVPFTSGTKDNATVYWQAVSGTTMENAMAVDTNSHLKLYGLEPGTYYLVEISTMSGYTLLADPIKIEIQEVTTENDLAQVTEIKAYVNGEEAQLTNGVVSLTVENTKNTNGFTLPQTGGAGTLAAIAVGLGLLSCGVILLVIFRRKEQR